MSSISTWAQANTLWSCACCRLNILVVFCPLPAVLFESEDLRLQSCICGPEKLRELQDIFTTAWKDSLVALAALLGILAAGEPLLGLTPNPPEPSQGFLGVLVWVEEEGTQEVFKHSWDVACFIVF